MIPGPETVSIHGPRPGGGRRSGRGPGVDFFSGGWETHRREPAYLAQGTNEHERNSIRKTRGGKRV